MKKILLLLAALFIVGINAFSQSLMWEHGYDKGGRFEHIYCITAIDSGNYMAGGSSSHYGRDFGDAYEGAVLVKLNANGDTIFAIPLGFRGSVKAICRTNDGNVFAAGLYIDSFTSYPVLVKVSQQGQIIWTQSYSNSVCFNVSKAVTTQSGGCIIVGDVPGFNTSVQQEFFALKTDKWGIQEWFNHFNPNTTYGMAYNVEKMLNGHYMVSGTSGASIRAVEIDTFGTQHGSYVSFYTEPNNTLLYPGCVYQLPDSGFVVMGVIRSSTRYNYIGKYAKSYGKVWSKTELGGALLPYINNDGSYLYYYGNPIKLERRNAWHLDSTLVWRAYLGSSLPNEKTLMSLASDGNNNAVLAGYYNTGTATEQDFYFCKIENTGTPYVPGQPVGVKDKFNSYKLTLYPNPATTQIRFNGLQQSGTLQLYNMHGQVVLNTAVSANESADVSSLAKGVYMWKISSVDKLFSGRLVKE